MDIGIVSSRYARALLKFATEKGENEAVYQGMSKLCDAFASLPNLRTTLENPVLEDEKKFKLLHLASGESNSACLMQFFRLIIKKNRVAMAQFMAHSYVGLYRKQQNLIHSRLIVPVELDSQTIDRLKQMVKEKTQNEVEFVVDIDPSIIGGFVLEYDTYSMDASIKGRLEKMRKDLLSNGKFLAS